MADLDSVFGPAEESFLAIYDTFTSGAPDSLRLHTRQAAQNALNWLRISWGGCRYEVQPSGYILSWEQIRQYGMYGHRMP